MPRLVGPLVARQAGNAGDADEKLRESGLRSKSQCLTGAISRRKTVSATTRATEPPSASTDRVDGEPCTRRPCKR
jgi:hypothetical protein